MVAMHSAPEHNDAETFRRDGETISMVVVNIP